MKKDKFVKIRVESEVLVPILDNECFSDHV